MTDSIPLVIQRDEVQLLRNRLNETWQFNHAQVMRAWDWEFIVRKCLRFSRELEIGWKITCQEAVTDEITDFRTRAESLRSVCGLMMEVAQTAYQKAHDFATASGHAIEGLEQLKTVPEDLERMREKFLFRLTLIDRDIIQEALAETETGDYPTPGDALADLLAVRHAARITPSYAELRRWADRCTHPPDLLEEAEGAS